MAPLRKYPAWVEQLLRQRQPANRGFTPYDLTEAPPGSYDPGLDYQAENEQLGFMFGGQDFELGRQRLDTDYGDQLAQIGLGESRGLADLLTSRTRGEEDYRLGGTRRREDYDSTKGRLTEDFGTARTRGSEDYGLAKGDIGLRYSRLADQQAGQARAAGLGEGGALAQALRKRAENQGRDVGRLDLGYRRQTEDLGRQESRGLFDLDRGFNRSNEDADRTWGRFAADNDQSRTRFGEDVGLQRQGALKGYQRGVTDLETGWQRQGLAHNLFQGQLGRQKLWQASQLGGLPTRPSNEFRDARGPYRIEMHGKQRWKRRPDGSYEVVR